MTGSVAIGNVIITEGDSGATVANFPVMRTGGTDAFSVNFATSDGTATAGSDYTATTGTLSFGVNVSSGIISVPIIGDTNVEPSETFFVNLSGATNGTTIGVGSGTGTISNDDPVA